MKKKKEKKEKKERRKEGRKERGWRRGQEQIKKEKRGGHAMQYEKRK